MHIISWNVNGIRAVVSKGFIKQIDNELNRPDIICLQETKAQDDQIAEALSDLEGYHIISNSADKKGYSGVAILSKQKPVSVKLKMGIDHHDHEGRVIAAEFENFWLVTVYTPNSQNELARLPYREQWDADFKKYLLKLKASKPVVVCGDLNVAHTENDIARPKANYNKSAGYTQKEIDGLQNIINAGFIDSFRYKNPEKIQYSWWSFRANARMKNIGWRIDYFLVSDELKESVKEAFILDQVTGSDHCPVGLKLI